MDRVRQFGDFLKTNKDVIQPVSSVLLCILVAVALFLPGRNSTVTIVQTTPPTGQANGQQTPSPEIQAVESANTTTIPENSGTYSSAIPSDLLGQSRSNSRQPTTATTPTTTTPPRNTTTPVPTTQPPKPITCDNNTTSGGVLTIDHDAAAMYRGEQFTVTIRTADSTPLGSVFINPTGQFKVSPATLVVSSSSTSIIAQYEGGFSLPAYGDPAPVYGKISITAYCGTATHTGQITVP